jgi:hypothetical protein
MRLLGRKYRAYHNQTERERNPDLSTVHHDRSPLY